MACGGLSSTTTGLENVGRPILAAAAFQAARRTRPRMLPALGDQPRLDWILLDVRPNAFELGLGPDQVIVAFVLPEGLAMAAEHFIGAIGGEPLQGRQPSAQPPPWV